MKLAGTKTEQNLLAGFAGESQARNKYTYFAAVARNEGYEEIAQNFEKTANHEKAHAERMANFLGLIGNTKENLTVAADGEHHEWAHMYQQFAADAQAEGLDEIAKFFTALTKAEEMHEKHYRAHLAQFEDKTPEELLNAAQEHENMLRCDACGYISSEHTTHGSMVLCPVCQSEMLEFEMINLAL